MIASALAGLDLLVGATPDQVAALAALVDRVEYSAGEVLFAEGDTGQSFVILVDGDRGRFSGDPVGLGIARRRLVGCDLRRAVDDHR